eukprot:gene6548-13244_t
MIGYVKDVSNKGEAERCCDIAKSYLTKGEYAKASKLFAKSLRLYPLPGVEALQQIAEKKLAESEQQSQSDDNGTRNQTNESNSSSSSPRTGSNNNSNNNRNSNNSSTNNNSNSNSNNKSSGSKPDTSESTSTSSGTTAAGSVKSRPFTEDQEKESKRILILSKKSHYEVLSLTKRCTEDEVKKAYRKLALKFHPDKNSAPSAEGAFKAISTAVETLSDPQKRAAYDDVGHEAFSQPNGGGGAEHFRRGGGGEMSPEDVFNMFFTGGMGPGGRGGGGGGFHMHFGPGGQMYRSRGGRTTSADDDQRQQQQQPNGRSWASFLQLLPMLILFLMSFSSMRSGGGETVYSLVQQGRLLVPQFTSTPGVVENIPYYVNDQFFMKYGRSSADLRRVEKAVENDFRETLARKCNGEREYKNRMTYQAKSTFYRTMEERTRAEKRAEGLKSPSCDKYYSYFAKNDQYAF